jgi:hypothetical protein
MLNKNTRIKIKNRNNGVVGYSVPDMNNLRRKFQPNEEKEVSYEELQKLSYTPGGMYMLKNYFILDNEEAIRTLIGGVELEYNYSNEDIKRLLVNGSMDELLDCLDFAPDGVIGLLKDIAVKLEISDLRKRDAIKEKTGFDVTKAIEINHARNEAEKAVEVTTPGRRVAQPAEKTTEGTTPTRRYNVSQK